MNAKTEIRPVPFSLNNQMNNKIYDRTICSLLKNKELTLRMRMLNQISGFSKNVKVKLEICGKGTAIFITIAIKILPLMCSFSTARSKSTPTLKTQNKMQSQIINAIISSVIDPTNLINILVSLLNLRN